jgi:hypothetical protein
VQRTALDSRVLNTERTLGSGKDRLRAYLKKKLAERDGVSTFTTSHITQTEQKRLLKNPEPAYKLARNALRCKDYLPSLTSDDSHTLTQTAKRRPDSQKDHPPQSSVVCYSTSP